jgi:hypothetical protein
MCMVSLESFWNHKAATCFYPCGLSIPFKVAPFFILYVQRSQFQNLLRVSTSFWPPAVNTHFHFRYAQTLMGDLSLLQYADMASLRSREFLVTNWLCSTLIKLAQGYKITSVHHDI